MNPPSTRLSCVLIVGASPLFRYAVASLVAGMQWLAACTDEVSDAPLARRLCEEKRPEMIVLDMDWPVGDGLGLLRDLSKLHPETRILALSEREDAGFMQRTFKAGAGAYVSKQDPVQELRSGLEKLAATEERFVSAGMKESVLRQVTNGDLKARLRGVESLSDRELEVFRLIGRGQSTKASAQGLGISEKTVETHRQRIKVKLGARDGEALKRQAADWLENGKRSVRT